MKILPEKAQKTIEAIKEEFEDISYALDERRKRLWCAAKAKAYNRENGKGGVTLVHLATKISRPTIYAGLKELETEKKLPKKQIRKKGGGRKKITKKTPEILVELEKLIEPLTRGDPESPLRISSDTAEFAVNSLRSWWEKMGKENYQEAKEMLITADCGGSNGYRVRLWKLELQKLANELGITINVSHFPPGTSKWNKIEHKMFCYISKNWRGQPLITRETVVNLIGNTTTNKGLKIQAMLDENIYEKGKKITDEQLNAINLEKSDFHGEWNYKIKPQNLV